MLKHEQSYIKLHLARLDTRSYGSNSINDVRSKDIQLMICLVTEGITHSLKVSYVTLNQLFLKDIAPFACDLLA